MESTSIQRRPINSNSLRLGVISICLVILVATYTMAISMVIVERAYSKEGKLAVIGLLLVTALLSLGIFERLKR